MLSDNHMETIIGAMAEKIQRLEGDVLLKDFEIGDLRRRVAELERKGSHHESD